MVEILTTSNRTAEQSHSAALSVSLRSVFSVGDLVVFNSNGLRGYIVEVNDVEDGEDQTCSIRYELERTRVEMNVSFCDITMTTIGRSENRSGTNRQASLPPSSNSDSTTRTNRLHNTTNTSTTANNNTIPSPYDWLKEAVKASATYQHSLQKQPQAQHPLMLFLQEKGRGKGKGWIRDILKHHDPHRGDGNTDIKPGSHLTQMESTILTVMTSIISGYSQHGGIMKGASGKLCHAFGIHKNSRIGIFNHFVDNLFCSKRKKRSDFGESVFTSEKRRKHTYTPFNTFKRLRYRDFRETSDRIPNATLKREYDELSNDQKEAYRLLAEQDLSRSRMLWDDLKEFLLKTKGKVPYSEMVIYLGNIVSKKTVMNILKKQEGFHIRKDRILPSLDTAAKLRRVVWAQTFWWFWKMALSCPVNDIQFALIHMDEKWFYAIRCRTNCKVLTSIGLEPHDYYCHHKNYLGKIMYIVVTAFIPHRNDITKGGVVIPVACIRVGRMIKAQKDTYKRVYKDDGTYHYPPIPTNLIRRRGEEYFQSLDITGSSEGTAQKPKCSLLKIYKEQIIPAIEEKVVAKYSQNGQKVCVVKQEDSAGPHQDSTYLSEMREEFAKREWIIFNQPSQSPVTNVHDACIFPMMSKEVSKEQAMSFGSTMLKTNQLHETVMKVWERPQHRYAMAKAFAAHPQIVCSILEHKGDNQYLTEKGGLSFGIRRIYHCNQEGDGVTLIDLAPQNENETMAQQIINRRRAEGLKYKPPDITTLTKANPTTEMKEILMSYAQEDLMTEDVAETWAELILSGDVT